MLVYELGGPGQEVSFVKDFGVGVGLDNVGQAQVRWSVVERSAWAGGRAPTDSRPYRSNDDRRGGGITESRAQS